MKKVFMTALLSISLLLGACSSSKLENGLPQKPAGAGVVDEQPQGEAASGTVLSGSEGAGEFNDTPDTPMGITVNIVSFEVLTENIPGDLESLIEDKKTTKGFIAKEIDGTWYVVVLMGEQNSGGYALEVTSIEDNEGKTIIAVEETAPDKDAMVTMAITYPYQVIKITSGIAPNFVVENQKGEAYTEIK